MPDISRQPLQSLWTEKLRQNLHNPASWSTRNDSKLIYVPSGAGFFGPDQMNSFCQGNGANSIWNIREDLQTVSCFVDESSGRVFDEFVVSWIQKSSRMEWMLPGVDLPLQKYQLSFAISAQIDPSDQLLKSVRVYWDQASFLLQSGVLMRSVRSLVRPGSSEALESALVSLPIATEFPGLLNGSSAHFLRSSKGEETRPAIGALNNITSILSDLPRSTNGPAVMTPQRAATTRALNPALLGCLKLAGDSFDSPLPANTRSVKSRNIFFEDEEDASTPKVQPRSKSIGLFEKASDLYHPGLGGIKDSSSHVFDQGQGSDSFHPGLGGIKDSSSHVFDQDPTPSHYIPTMNLNEEYSHQYESQIFNPDAKDSSTKSVNMPQTDKIIFESHVFDSIRSETCFAASQPHVATAPPQQPSSILSQEDNLKSAPEATSATLSRPGMMGHFRGSSFGDSNEAESKFMPSTAIRFDPNRSQILMGDADGQHEKEEIRKGSKRMDSNPPAGRSTIFD